MQPSGGGTSILDGLGDGHGAQVAVAECTAAAGSLSQRAAKAVSLPPQGVWYRQHALTIIQCCVNSTC